MTCPHCGAQVALGSRFCNKCRKRLSPVRHGYEFTFVPGSPAPGGDSPTSLSGWAYVAVPTKVGQTGIRSFCVDARGLICSDSSGSVPETMDGSCSISSGTGCVPLN